MRGKLKTIIGKLIGAIDKFQSRGHTLDQQDDTKKIIDTVDVSDRDLYVLSDSGLVKVSKIHKTQPYRVYRIKTKHGRTLECADRHKVFCGARNAMTEVFVKDLNVGDRIYTITGMDEVIEISELPYSHTMYDLTIDHPTHRYFTNDILSHNTTTTVAILAWLLCFGVEKNIFMMANKQVTSKEVVNKLIEVFKNLPFFLKPGCIAFNTEAISLDNGCRVISQTTTASSAIGFTIDVLYLDEFAHVDPSVAAEFWRSVYPTITASETSRCIISSTPNGMGNKFFDIWDKSQKGENTFASKKVYWWQVPGRGEEYEKMMRANYGEEEFEQEFNLSFNVSSKMLLKPRDLELMNRISTEYVSVDLPNLRKDLNEKLLWHPDFDPTMIDYERDAFILSVDTAQGTPVSEGSKVSSDYNVINIFKILPLSEAQLRNPRRVIRDERDCFRMVQVGIYMDNTTNEKCSAIVARYITFDLFKCGVGLIDNTRVLVEVNFNGGLFLEVLRNHELFYDAVLIHTQHRQANDGEFIPAKAGYKTTPHNRSYYIDLGRDGIEDKRIVVTHIAKKDNESTVGQLASFGKNKKGKYEGIAIHDDISMTTLNVSRLFDNEDYQLFLSTFYDEKLHGIPTYIAKAINSYVSEDDAQLNVMLNAMLGYDKRRQEAENRDEEIRMIYNNYR